MSPALVTGPVLEFDAMTNATLVGRDIVGRVTRPSHVHRTAGAPGHRRLNVDPLVREIAEVKLVEALERCISEGMGNAGAQEGRVAPRARLAPVGRGTKRDERFDSGLVLAQGAE